MMAAALLRCARAAPLSLASAAAAAAAARRAPAVCAAVALRRHASKYHHNVCEAERGREGREKERVT